MRRNARYLPLIRNAPLRTGIGFGLLILSVMLAWGSLGKGRIEITALITAVVWMFSIFLTDKYIHKYPRRYFTYLLASHLKAAVIMAFFLWIMSEIADGDTVSQSVLWTGFALFIVADALVSFFSCRDLPEKEYCSVDPVAGSADIAVSASGEAGSITKDLPIIDREGILNQIRGDLDPPMFEFIEQNVRDLRGGTQDVLILDDISEGDDLSLAPAVPIVVGRIGMNDVRRLHRFLMFSARRIIMGGSFVVRYLPLENVMKDYRRRYRGLRLWAVYILHFLWYRAIPKIPWLDKLYFSPVFSWMDSIHLSLTKKRNRALPRAEVWGRLAFWGMQVIKESKGDGELFIMAQRVSSPHKKIPSYYLIAPLEKVGLDGQIFRTHKIRTMYPFSEFLQQRIFEDHGLAPTGKFANDFRLTDYGAFLRKYWLDELPGIFDWLRGEIKLVGMRATSPHYLSLYPKDVYDLYIQVKPGLIPPIFGESTNGFDEIVKVEYEYLKSYMANPVRTDIRYFCKTFADIVLRGVRSK